MSRPAIRAAVPNERHPWSPERDPAIRFRFATRRRCVAHSQAHPWRGVGRLNLTTRIPSRRSSAHLVSVKVRIVTLGGGRLSRGTTIALAIAALAVGGVFLALGIALLATLALVGTVVAAGLAVARLVRGRPALPARERQLDPSMEVFPPDANESRRIEDNPGTR